MRSGIKPTSSRTLGQVLNPLNHSGNSYCLFLDGREPMQSTCHKVAGDIWGLGAGVCCWQMGHPAVAMVLPPRRVDVRIAESVLHFHPCLTAALFTSPLGEDGWLGKAILTHQNPPLPRSPLGEHRRGQIPSQLCPPRCSICTPLPRLPCPQFSNHVLSTGGSLTIWPNRWSQSMNRL